MAIQCFIIDHHPLNLKILESYIFKTPFFELVGSVSSCQAYDNFTVNSDIILINVDSMQSDALYAFKNMNQILIFMADLPNTTFDMVKLDRNYKNTGFLQLPATYQVFIEEIERLIQ